MKKKIKKTGLLLTGFIAAIAMTAVPAFADGKVTYDGDAQKFIFEPGSEYSPTDLFEDFKDVMPGDSLTDTITVSNKNITDKKVKIYMRSLGAQEDTDAFLSQLSLTVDETGASTLFEAPADESAQLTDWVLLGTLSPGGSAELSVTLNVPIDLDNEYADSIGYLDWEFMVEEIPDESPTPTPTAAPKKDSNKKGSSTDTGDSTDLGMYYTLIGCAAGACVVVTAVSKKAKKKNK